MSFESDFEKLQAEVNFIRSTLFDQLSHALFREFSVYLIEYPKCFRRFELLRNFFVDRKIPYSFWDLAQSFFVEAEEKKVIIHGNGTWLGVDSIAFDKWQGGKTKT